MAEKINPFYKLLKTEVPINITLELKETIDSVNKALSDACQLALKQPIPGIQLVLRKDASFRSAGYALMTEDNPDKKNTIKAENVRPRAVWLKNILPCETQDVDILKRSFGNLYGTSRLCTHPVGSNKANNCPDRQQVRQPFFPNKGNSASTLDCM